MEAIHSYTCTYNRYCTIPDVCVCGVGGGGVHVAQFEEYQAALSSQIE